MFALRRVAIPNFQKATLSTSTSQSAKSKWRKVAVAVAAGAGLATAAGSVALASDLILNPPRYQWTHNGMLASYDHESIRRGYEVYKQVCATCHSIQFMRFRHLVDVSHTEAEAKAEAQEIEVLDGPNDEGEMFEREGKLSDAFPAPYKNEEEARFANNGAYPPDLSYITSARNGGEDYVYALLTGYCDPPAGIELADGMSYNPYFPGGAIGMPQQLFEGRMDYSDGTPATVSQMAKDVVAFLKWCAEPEHDQRKRMGLKAMGMFAVMALAAGYYNRMWWSSIKTGRMAFKYTEKAKLKRRTQ